MPQAEADLEAIREYYERVAPDYAQTFVDGAVEKTHQLEAFPRIGRTVPEIGDEDLRELIYRQYRIVYIVSGADDERADVLTIFHSAKQFGASDLS
jgi:plasmid stabilization system protein ParE